MGEMESLEELKRIYYDVSHPAGYGSLAQLARSMKGKLSRDEVKEWLQSQETYTLHRPVRKRFPRNRYIVSDMNVLWQVDLSDMQSLSDYNDDFKYIFCIMRYIIFGCRKIIQYQMKLLDVVNFLLTRAALKVLRKSKTEQTSKLLVLFYLFKIVSIHINTSLHPMEPLRKALCPLVLRGLFDGHLKRSHCFLGVHKTFSSKFFFYFRE